MNYLSNCIIVFELLEELNTLFINLNFGLVRALIIQCFIETQQSTISSVLAVFDIWNSSILVGRYRRNCKGLPLRRRASVRVKIFRSFWFSQVQSFDIFRLGNHLSVKLSFMNLFLHTEILFEIVIILIEVDLFIENFLLLLKLLPELFPTGLLVCNDRSHLAPSFVVGLRLKPELFHDRSFEEILNWFTDSIADVLLIVFVKFKVCIFDHDLLLLIDLQDLCKVLPDLLDLVWLIADSLHLALNIFSSLALH